MTVTLTQYGPPLDPALALLYELYAGGEAELTVPRHPDATGLANDVIGMVYRIYPYVDSSIRVAGERHTGYPRGMSGKRDPRVRNSFMSVVMTNDDFNAVPAENLFTSSVITTSREDNFNRSPRINVHTAMNRAAVHRSGAFMRRMQDMGMPVPSAQPELTSVKLSHNSLIPFGIDAPYQTSEKYGVKRGDRLPVSARDVHDLLYGFWSLIDAPVYNDAWGVYMSETLMILSGEKSVDSNPRQKPFVLGRLNAAQKLVYNSVNAMLTGISLTSVIRNHPGVRNNDYYEGIHLRPFLNTFNHLVNPDSLAGDDRTYLDAFVNGYNQYAQKHALAQTTPETLVSVASRQKQIPRRA